jgi:hypothetical protein
MDSTNPPRLGNWGRGKKMARYILIDNYTGYVFGDSADIDGRIVTGTPCEVASALDASIGEHGRTYTERPSAPRDTSTGYHVYRADINGSEAVPVATDGQDAEYIAAVQRDCEFVCYVAWS